MRIPGLPTIRAGVKKLWNRSRPVGIVLLYHRVADSETDPQLLSVRIQRFADQMNYLSQRYEVVSLHELIHRKATHSSSEVPLVAVTFDDGYADNLINAKPILESMKIPATVFVTSGYLDGIREFWWDALESVFLRPSALPNVLRLAIDSHLFEWDLAADAVYLPTHFEINKNWNVLCPEDPTIRHRIYRSLCTMLRPLAEELRQEALRTIDAWAGARREIDIAHRVLTREEVRALASGPWIEVGAHTESHPVLAQMPARSQSVEIAQSKKRLEGILERSVKTFAYPYGTRADYTQGTVTLVREHGFDLACANYPEKVTRTTDIFQLPRFVVRDWCQDRFGKALESWWEGMTGEESYIQ